MSASPGTGSLRCWSAEAHTHPDAAASWALSQCGPAQLAAQDLGGAAS